MSEQYARGASVATSAIAFARHCMLEAPRSDLKAAERIHAC
ncbi:MULTISPECIES: hypothetical protein [Brasilonema]|nr:MULTISPECIES: hypothetical protein [Brasilonema]